MKKMTLIITLTIICFLLASLNSYAQIVLDITGLRTMCPTGYFTPLYKGSRTLCIQKDPRVVAVTITRGGVLLDTTKEVTPEQQPGVLKRRATTCINFGMSSLTSSITNQSGNTSLIWCVQHVFTWHKKALQWREESDK